jgi:hypothetical protein
MPTPGQVLKAFRVTHLYLGVFITPAILFFALTGALQTFSFHESPKGSDYQPAKWITTLSQLHKKQTIALPTRRPKPPAEIQSSAEPRVDSAPAKVRPVAATQAPAFSQPPNPPKRPNTLPMKIYFLVVAIGLFLSTATGLYMSYRFNRNRVALSAAFVAGLVIPIVLLFV